MSYAQLQASLDGCDKKTAVSRLHEMYPHVSKSFLDRNYLHLLDMDPLGVAEVLGHSDPTPKKAIRNIERKEKDADVTAPASRDHHRLIGKQ